MVGVHPINKREMTLNGKRTTSKAAGAAPMAIYGEGLDACVCFSCQA
jgi:hypothetical protein